MIIEAYQSESVQEFVMLKVPVRYAVCLGKSVFTSLTPEEAQELAEQLLAAAARSRAFVSAQNQPHLFAVSDLLAGRA